MNKTIEQITAELDKDLAASAVKSRSQSGTTLSYVDTFYVIKRLNECFGNLGWDSETVRMEQVLPGNKDKNGNDLISYRALVRITAIVSTGDGGYMKVTKEGTGWGSDKSTNNPHEMAAKEAESDALKRAAMKFGMSLGLALYDKTKEHVDDDKPAKATPKYTVTQDGSTAAVIPASPKKHSSVEALMASPELAEAKELGRASARATINKTITAASLALLNLAGPEGTPERTAKSQEIKAMLTAYGVDSKEKLTDTQAQELVNKLKEMTNGK